eukprot:190122_1
MTTESTDESKLLVAGYVRDHCKICGYEYIPFTIISIIVFYIPLKDFWSQPTGAAANAIVLSDDKKTALFKSHSKHTVPVIFIVGHQRTKRITAIYSWSIKMHITQKTSGCGAGICCDFDSIQHSQMFYLYWGWSPDLHWIITSKMKWLQQKQFVQKYSERVGTDDVVQIIFNSGKGTLSFKLNGKEIGKQLTNLDVEKKWRLFGYLRKGEQLSLQEYAQKSITDNVIKFG